MSVSLRARQAALLVGPLVRLVPWSPVAAAAVLALLALLPAVLGGPAPATQVWGLRIAAVLLGAGASFAMADLMVPVAVTPTPRWLRQWLRFTIGLVPVAGCWWGLYLLAVASLPDGGVTALPGAGLAVEAAVCGLTAMAGAAVAARSDRHRTAPLAGPAAQALLLALSLFLTGRWTPWPLPAAGTWEEVHRYWLVALLACVVVLWVANRDGRPPGSAALTSRSLPER
jgi:hypothetical protein